MHKTIDQTHYGLEELGAILHRPRQAINPAYAKYTNPERIAGHKLLKMVEEVKSGAVVLHTVGCREKVRGAAAWRTLRWDSNLLGMLTARIDDVFVTGSPIQASEDYSALLSEVVDACRQRQVRYLTIRVDAADVTAIHALENRGFQLIDSIQTFSLGLESPETAHPKNVHQPVRSFEANDLEDVLLIARASYVCDRFHTDPVIGKETADALNEAWLRNSAAGVACDQVIVGVDELGVTSYATCKLDLAQKEATGLSVGTIVMVATAARARGQGWALATSLGAVDWFRTNGVQVVEVGTQLRNTAAACLYLKAGFRPTGATFTFRKLLE